MDCNIDIIQINIRDITLKIDKHILGELISSLESVFSEYSKEANTYIFSNKNMTKSMAVEEKQIYLTFKELNSKVPFKELEEIIFCIQKYIPEDVKIIVLSHCFLSNDGQKFKYKSEFINVFSKFENNGDLRTLGFEKLVDDWSYFYDYQIRPDNLETRVAMHFKPDELISINNLPREILDRFSRAKSELISTNLFEYN